LWFSLKVHNFLGADIVITRPGAPPPKKKQLRHCIVWEVQFLVTNFASGSWCKARRIARGSMYWRGTPLTSVPSLTCIGNQQTAKMATTTMTMRVTLFLPLRLSADTWPPGAAPRQSRSSSHRYRPQISARGITYDVAKKIICTQRTLVSVDPANRCCYVFELLASSELCIFPSAV
jgi:hypothetical protein